MKKFAVVIAVIAALSANLYPGFGKVVKVDRKRDTVTVKTYGCTYKMKGCEDWHKGDYVALMMYDNHTKKISDDIIIKAYYINENF